MRSRGVIRLIDGLFVMKDEAGAITSIEASDLSDAEAAQLGTVLRGLLSQGAGSAPVGAPDTAEGAGGAVGLTAADIRDVAEAIAPGTSALLLLFEHSWAAGLAAAMRDAGGRMLAQGMLTREAVLMIGAELQAVMEAEATIAVAEAIQGAAMLDALATVEAAEAVKSAAVAEAVRALIVAGLIEAAAAREALDVLVTAGVIEQAALDEAAQAVAAGKADVEETKAAQAQTV